MDEFDVRKVLESLHHQLEDSRQENLRGLTSGREVSTGSTGGVERPRSSGTRYPKGKKTFLAELHFLGLRSIVSSNPLHTERFHDMREVYRRNKHLLIDDDSDDGGEGSPVRNRPGPTPRSPGDALEWPPD